MARKATPKIRNRLAQYIDLQLTEGYILSEKEDGCDDRIVVMLKKPIPGIRDVKRWEGLNVEIRENY